MAYKLVLSDDALEAVEKMDRHVGMMLAKDLEKTFGRFGESKTILGRPW